MRGRCLVAGVLPLHDVVADVVDGLRAHGWNIDVKGWRGPAPDAEGSPFASGLSSNWTCVRDAARLARRMQRELAAAASASAWFRDLEGTLSTDRYDVALVLTDLAPPGLTRLATRAPVPAIVISLVALAQELRHRRWLPIVRALAALKTHGAALHHDLLRAADAGAIQTAVFPSSSWRDAAAAAGITRERTHVIPYGVPVPATLPERPARLAEPIRLLWAGRMSPEKGLHLFLDALPRVRRRFDVRLTAIGSSGPAAYARQVAERMRRYGLAQVVEVRPAVSRPAMIEEFSRHDLLLFHSVFQEPVAQVMLHAAAAGLPVVGPASRCRTTLLREPETAWCYPDSSPEQMAAAVLRALDSDHERTRRARALHAELRAHQQLSATIDRYDQLLLRLCAQSLEDHETCLTVPC